MGEQKLLFDVTPPALGARLLSRLPPERRAELIRVLGEAARRGLHPAKDRREEQSDEG
jgi:hypothetical protein